MALTRRSGQRMNASIWPGFVDAMTALLLVLMFVLSIFMIVQSVLRETIDTQGNELGSLAAQVAGLADALGLERTRAAGLEAEIGQLGNDLSAAQAEGQTQAALIASLSGQLQARGEDLVAASVRISDFEAQVASLLAERNAARGQAGVLTATVAELQSARTQLLGKQEALNLALASARQEIDAQTEAARLAAARSDALDALVADLRRQQADGKASLTDALARLAQSEDTAETRRADLAKLAAQLAEAQDAVSSRVSEAEALAAQVASLQSDLSVAQAAGADAETLRARMADLEKNLTEAERQKLAQLALAEALRRSLSDAQQNAAARTTEAEALAAQVAALQSDARTVNLDAENLRARMAELETQLTAAERTKLADLAAAEALRRQLSEAKSDIRSRQERADALAAEVASLTSDLKTAVVAQADAKTLRARMAELEAQLTAAERAKLTDLAAAEALRRKLAGSEARLSDQEAALLAERAAAAELRKRLDATETDLTNEEKARLADMAAAEALRAKLAGSKTELTAMTLALEEQRKRAEDTLTLLAAAQMAADEAAGDLTGRDALLATARAQLTTEQERSADAARKTALLNEQISALRGQLGNLQGLLDAAAARDSKANVRLDALGSQLNTALAQVAAEQRRRAELEEAERKRLEVRNADLEGEAKKLENFRSEFFGQLRRVLAGREGVQVVGDRFVFSSEVLFPPGSAELAPAGADQIAGVVAMLREISDQIPPGIDWIIRVDGHTDNVPLSGTGVYADNWELSQARALSVVRFMQDGLGFPPNRLAATGFGEWQPVALGDSTEARAQNRRIELKLTER